MKFVKMGINGEGIGYLHHKPVFVNGVFPNETAEIKITEEKEHYCRGEVIRMIWRSKERMKTDYPYYEAEGCPLFPMRYDAQLLHKRQLLTEALYKYAHVKEHFVRDVKPSPLLFGYRNACKLPVRENHDGLTTGMYMPGTNHFQTILHSRIDEPLLDQIRTEVLKVCSRHHLHPYDEKKRSGLRYLSIRVLDGKGQCTLVTGKENLSQDLIEELMRIDHLDGLFQSVNTAPESSSLFGTKPKRLAGEETLDVIIDNIHLHVSPDSFFQLNTAQAVNLYQMAVAKIDPCDTIAEAYCGIGAMSLLAHKKAKHIYGIESVASAVENAKRNAEENHIANTEFLCADAAAGLLKVSAEREINCLLADPPRSGMDQNMIQAVMTVLPKKIIYISCNPATLAKNLNDLKHQYHVVTILPYDMFPHTPHIESITVLERDNYAPGQAH